MADKQQIYDTLKEYWGYDTFRPMQLEVIESVLSGHDTLALMPTGAGKSLLYQLPGMLMDGVCVVVTPLVALMKDQVDGLRKVGIPASAIHSGLAKRQIDIILDNACWGDLKFLFVAPERLSAGAFRERFARMPVSLLAVDEAHCISQWGYDFRPSYLRIGELRELNPDMCLLALTASATPPVAKDILRNLHMKDGRTVRSSFARPNISFAVRHTDDKQGQLLRVINNVPGSGIVYVRTREQAENVASWLRNEGVGAEHYHAGMTYGMRSEVQDKWIKGHMRVIVSTNAFGMGIDKPDVRFVAHYDLCDSVEAYYQEAGRAGRDGRRSYAVLLSGSDDQSRVVKRFETEYPPMDKIKECYQSLFDYLQIGVGDGKYASFAFDLGDFSRKAKMYTATALNSLKILQQNGYLSLSDETDNPPRILFTVGRDDLYKVRIDREELDHIIRTILRLYAGVFGERLIPIDENEIAHTSGYTIERVKELLKKLWQLRIIKYVPGNRSPILLITEERLPAGDVYISPESYRIRKEMAAKRLEAIMEYAGNEGKCRSVLLQEYFGEEDIPGCGVCDICLEERKAAKTEDTGSEIKTYDDQDNIRNTIVGLLKKEPCTVKQIVENFSTAPQTIINAIDFLMEEGVISARPDGKVEIKG